MPERPILDPSRVITVHVPATSANLGPGFDALGLALTLYNTFTFRLSPDNQHHLSGIGEGAENFSTTNYEDSLILKSAFFTAVQETGEILPHLSVYSEVNIPLQRGLGSSATAVAAGILGINALLALNADPWRLLKIAAMMEHHADNVTAAIRGGLQCVALLDNGIVIPQAIPIAPSFLEHMVIVACVPVQRMGTAASRKVLPEKVPFQDATFSAGRAALQVAAWVTGNTEALAEGLSDRLHQPYRLPQIAGNGRGTSSADWAFERAQKFGAIGSCLSGSGSTLLSFCPDEATAQKVGEEMRETLQIHKTPVEAVHLLRIDTTGATVQITSDPA